MLTPAMSSVMPAAAVSVAQPDERARARHLERVAFVVGAEAVDELAVVGDERQLGGGVAC